MSSAYLRLLIFLQARGLRKHYYEQSSGRWWKVHIVKAMVSSVVIYGYESWTIKEGWVPKNWCFQIVVLEKILESPLDCKRSNQSILKEISSEYSLEGLMLKLKLQYFSHLMWRADSLEKTQMLEKVEGRRRRGQKSMRWLDGTTDSMDNEIEQTPGDSGGHRSLVCYSPRGCKELDMTWRLHNKKLESGF